MRPADLAVPVRPADEEVAGDGVVGVVGPVQIDGDRPTNILVAIEDSLGLPGKDAVELDNVVGVLAASLDARPRPHHAGAAL